jgi:hypothetical protein
VRIPKKTGAVVDLLYRLRDKRLAMQKKVDEVKRQESELREHLFVLLERSGQTGVTGQSARAKVLHKKIPTVKDWEALHTHIVETGDFALLQRRMNDGHARALWEDGKKIPGVEVFNKRDLSLTKA